MNRWALLLLLPAVGCAGHAETGIFMHHADMEVQTIHAPKVDRCQTYKGATSMYSRCQTFREQAIKYVRNLNTGDTVCVQGGFGEPMTDKCKARGQVMDADDRGLLIMIHDPTLDSKWKNDDGKQYYFENGALVDLYLAESGFQ